jgi:hypothetical protein
MSENLRDQFAAAALTGLLSHSICPNKVVESYVQLAFLYADAMLRARGTAFRENCVTGNNPEIGCPTNHDAAPAARAAEPESSAPLGSGAAPANTTFPPVASTGPINRNAASQSPDTKCGGGEPLDDTRPDTKGEAPGGRGHNVPCSRTREQKFTLDVLAEVSLEQDSYFNWWVINQARLEIERLRLTKSERFVLQEVRDIYANEDDVQCNEIAAVLDGLLERTK